MHRATPFEKVHVGEPGPAGSMLWAVALLTGVLGAQLLHLRRRPDIDLWLHLRIGDLLRDGVVFGNRPDPLVTLADKQYVPSQWLAQEAFSWVYQVAGLTGVLVVRLLLIALLVAILYLACRLAVAPVPAAVSAMVAMVATAAAWGERPQLVGLVLESAVVLAWVGARTRGRAPWVLIPMIWLWACVHGSWVVGIATGMVWTLAILFDRPSRIRARPLLLVNVLSVAAVATTPLGPGLLAEPFAVNDVARQTVNEWQTPAPSNPLFILVLIMTAIVILRGARRWRTSLPELITAAAAASLAVYSVRTVAFGAVMLAPAFAAAVGGPQRGVRRSLSASELWPWLAALVLLSILPGAIVGVDRRGPLGPASSAALRALPAGSHVAVDVRVSGWVLHEFPHLRPLRDLRVEVYSPNAAARFESLISAKPGWQQTAKDERVAAVVADSTGPLVQQLRKQTDWSEVADERGYALWAPAAAPDR